MFTQKLTLAVAIPFISLGAGLAPAALAQNDEVKLPTQVASATGFRQEALLAPAAITVITKEEIQAKPVSDLGEVFRDVPGVALVDSQVSGMKRLSIRGEDSRRVLIKINGQPLADHSNYGTPLLLDPNMIERIEIVRGSASVVHGSNALGGVVNITTRQANVGEVELFASAGLYSATRGYRASAGVLGASEKLDYRLQASTVEHQDRRIPHGKLVPSDTKDKSVSAELGFRLDEQQRIAWQGDYFDQEANAWLDDTTMALSFPKRKSVRNALSYEYANDHALLQRIEARAYYQDGTRDMSNTVNTPALNTDILSTDDLTVRGAQLTAQSQLLGNNISLFGVEYQQDKLDKKVATDIEFLMAVPPMPVIPPPSHSTDTELATQSFISAFVQQQIKLTQALEANLGVRYYHMESKLKRSDKRATTKKDDDQYLGSAGLVWQSTEQSALRANIAQGYTYPSLTQQFSAVRGGGVMNYGNTELKPETATTYELGYRFDGTALMLDATLYYSSARDFIDKHQLTGKPTDFTATCKPAECFEWININQSQTYGAELDLAYQLDSLRPYTQLSVQRRKLTDLGQSTWHSGLPIYRARLGTQWQATDKMMLDAFLRSYGKSKRYGFDEKGKPETQENSTYFTLNLSAQYQALENLNITMALNNLTNKSYQHPDELPGSERSVDVEVGWHF